MRREVAAGQVCGPRVSRGRVGYAVSREPATRSDLSGGQDQSRVSGTSCWAQDPLRSRRRNAAPFDITQPERQGYGAPGIGDLEPHVDIRPPD
jgi:hypothetical protein